MVLRMQTLYRSVVVKRESKSEALDLLDDLRPNPHLRSRLGEVTESSRLSKQGDTTLFVLLVPHGARPMQLSKKYYDQISCTDLCHHKSVLHFCE